MNTDLTHPSLAGLVTATMYTTRNVIVAELGGVLISGAEIVANESGFAVTGSVLRDGHIVDVDQELSAQGWARLFANRAITGAFEKRQCGTRPAPRPNPAPRTPPCKKGKGKKNTTKHKGDSTKSCNVHAVPRPASDTRESCKKRKRKKDAAKEKSITCDCTYTSENECVARYNNATATMHCGDTYEFMEKMEPGSVRCIFTDPPYETTKHQWDQIDILRFIKLAVRCLSDDGYLILFGSLEQIAWYRQVLSELYGFTVRDGAWLKTQPKPTNNGITIAKEHYIVAYTSKAKHLSKLAKAPWDFVASANYTRKERVNKSDSIGAEKVHEAQKPAELITKILRIYARRGDTVFDPFGGSFPTGRVCLLAGNDYIGIENRREVYEPSTLAFQSERIMSACHEQYLVGMKSIGEHILEGLHNTLEKKAKLPAEQLVEIIVALIDSHRDELKRKLKLSDKQLGTLTETLSDVKAVEHMAHLPESQIKIIVDETRSSKYYAFILRL